MPTFIGQEKRWGEDETFIYTMRGWVLCDNTRVFKEGRFSDELQEERNNIESSLPTSPPNMY